MAISLPTLNLSMVGGNYTPGAEFDIRTIIGIANYCSQIAQLCTKETDISLENAIARLGNPPSMNAAVATPLPVIDRPTVIIPERAPESEVIQIAQNVTDLIDKLLPLYVNFHKTYFPLTQATGAAAELWIQGVINGGEGLLSAIEEALWENDRERILLEAERQSDEAASLYAGRGFSLPPGALMAAQRAIQQQSLREISASSRAAVLARAELVKFAIENSLKLRSLAVEAANDYIEALVSSVMKAGEFFERQNDGQQKLISAAADWYRAEAGAKEIVWKARLSQAELVQDASKTNVGVTAEYAKAQAELAAQEAEALAQLASSAANNLQLSARVGYDTSLSG